MPSKYSYTDVYEDCTDSHTKPKSYGAVHIPEY